MQEYVREAYLHRAIRLVLQREQAQLTHAGAEADLARAADPVEIFRDIIEHDLQLLASDSGRKQTGLSREEIQKLADHKLAAFLEEQRQQELAGQRRSGFGRDFIDLWSTLLETSCAFTRFCGRAAKIAAVTTAIVLTISLSVLHVRAHREVATVADMLDARVEGRTLTPHVSRLTGKSAPIVLKTGVMKIMFDCGVKVVVESPADFQIESARRVSLHKGKLYAEVSELGHGFRVDTPNSSIIDLGVPIVCSPYTRETIPGVANIITDQEAIGCMAAEHLLTQGLRCFAYCSFDNWWWSRRRRDSFARRVAEAGFEMHEYEVPAAGEQRLWDMELPHIAAWLQGLPKPAGIMGCNDDRGALIIDACKLVGLKVPDDVAVVGVDNDELICDLCTPPLSSVATSLSKTGYEAAALLDRMIQGKEEGRPTLCIEPTHVVSRQSTDVLAVDDPAVVSALRFIRQHGRRNIGVQEVADRTGVSRRLLEKRFRRLVGHSIHDEIQRVRGDLVARMLLETHMPVAEIAEAMQFTDAAHLARFFQRERGCSPTQYRLRHAL